MRNPQGYALILDPAAPLVERDTITCGHCNRIIFIKPGHGITTYLLQRPDGLWTEEPGAFCRICMRPVCLVCHDHGRCLPLEARLAAAEATQPRPWA